MGQGLFINPGLHPEHTLLFPCPTVQKAHAMGASVVLLLPVILLLVSIQGALATVTPFLAPVSQVSTI